MNKTFIVLSLLALIVLGSSCRKYDEGPGVSFIPKKNRVSNEWAFASAIESDIDVTADYDGAVLDLGKTGSVDFDYIIIENGTKTSVQELGEWEFDKDKTHLVLLLESSTGTYRMGFRILELKNNSMHLISEEEDKDWHLISNNLR